MLLAVAKITTFNEVLELAGAEATSRVAELEGPQEVGGLLKVGTDSEDLVDKILHADNAVLAKVLLNDRVIGKSNALLVNLAISALVDELLDALEVGIAVGDPRLNNLDHLRSGLGDTDEDTVVDLEQTEELEDLAGLRGNLIDTGYELVSRHFMTTLCSLPLDADDEDQLRLGRDIESSILLGGTRKTNLLALGLAVLLDVGLGTLEDDATLLLVGLYSCQRRLSKEVALTMELVYSIRPERWLIGRQHRRI